MNSFRGRRDLFGANTYSGPTTINAGTVVAGAANVFSAASPTTVNSGGTLDISGYNQTVSSLWRRDSGKHQPKHFRADADADQSGRIVDVLGRHPRRRRRQGPGQDQPNAEFAQQYSDFDRRQHLYGRDHHQRRDCANGNGGTTGSIVGDATNDGTLAFDHSDRVDFAGVVRGSGSLTQLGGGTLTLSGANTYTGGTTVSAGILSVSGSIGSASTPSGAINIASGGTLSTSGDSSIDIGSASITNAGLLDNDGAITAGALSNLVGASLVNKGVLTDDLNNSGTVVNYGTYTANIASNSGAITNNAYWEGSVNNTAGTITNNWVWYGSADNNIGGTINNTGTWYGSVNNTAGTITNYNLWYGSANNTGGTIDNRAEWNGDITNAWEAFSTKGRSSARLPTAAQSPTITSGTDGPTTRAARSTTGRSGMAI